MTQIRAHRLITPDREVRPGAVDVEGGSVVSVGAGPGDDTLAGVLIPGLVDLQCNGAAGFSLADATEEAFDGVGKALLASGTTAYCPTLPSAPTDTYPRFLDAARAAQARRGPRIPGVHLEGPFLNPVRAGAHDPRHLRAPDPDWLAGLLDSHPGLVRIVTLAPELPGALEVIACCLERGVVPAVGHTDATLEQAEAGFAAGVRLVTHLFNAMRPIHHRDPGVGGAALGHPDVRCSLIADGAHVHPPVAPFFARGLGPHRTVLVSDAVATPTRDPLSGGFVLLDGAVRHLVDWGIPLPDAVRMATATPADVLARPELGRLEPSANADMALWVDGRVASVWVGGEPA